MMPVPNQKRMAQVMSVARLESRIEVHAREKPASSAERSECPARSSSLRRSKIRILASTAIPMESTKPAIPANVNTTGMSLNSANTTAAYIASAITARSPGKR